MRTELAESVMALSRVIELSGGVGTALVGLIIWLHIFIFDMSHGAQFKLREDAPVFLMFVAPGILVAIGSYLQVRRRQGWAVAVILVGALLNIFFQGINARLVFVLSGDIWGQRAVLVDFALVIITISGAGINTIASASLRRRVQMKDPVDIA